jgi:DNA-binding NarL/FixJ family response regulator
MSSERPVRVFLLAENRLLREVLFRLLARKNDIHMVGASACSADAREEIISARPGILVLDSRGLALSDARFVLALHAAIPDLRIVMVDMDVNESTFLKAVREGIVGFVLKDASAAEVAAAIRGVAAGEAVCPAPLCMSLFRFVAQQMVASPSPSGTPDFGLSPREQQMVALLRERLTNKQIAARLNVSEQTVKNHVHNMLRKLGAPNRSSIVARCTPEAPRASAA